MRKTSEENGRKSSAGSGKPSYSASEKRTFKPASDSKRTFGKSEPKNETKSRFLENSQSGKKSVGDYRKPERTAERPTYKKFDSKPGFTDKKGGSDWESPKKSFTKPEGGLFIFAFLQEGLDALSFLRPAIDRGLAFVPGESFYVEGGHKNTLRLNFSGTDLMGIQRGMDILKDCLSGIE